MIKSFVLFIALQLFISNLFAQGNYGVTVFGTDNITEAYFRSNYGNLLDQLVEAHKNDKEDYRTQLDSLNTRLALRNKYAYSKAQLFKSYSGKFDFIIDFVEREDSIERLNFRQVNYRVLEDPDSLLSKWKAYEELSFSLFEKREIGDMTCPVIHCIWSFHHDKLAPFLAIFNELAPANKDALIDILNTSAVTGDRAAAAFLLAHAGMQHQDYSKCFCQACMTGKVS